MSFCFIRYRLVVELNDIYSGTPCVCRIICLSIYPGEASMPVGDYNSIPNRRVVGEIILVEVTSN